MKKCRTCKHYDYDDDTCAITNDKANARGCGEYEYDPFAGEPETDIQAV